MTQVSKTPKFAGKLTLFQVSALAIAYLNPNSRVTSKKINVGKVKSWQGISRESKH